MVSTTLRCKFRINFHANALDMYPALADAFQGKIFRLHGNQNRVGCHQRVQRQQIECWRTVQDYVLEAITQGRDRFLQAITRGALRLPARGLRRSNSCVME